MKNSAILPAVEGGTSIFRRGTCSLSTQARWGNGDSCTFIPTLVVTLEGKRCESPAPWCSPSWLPLGTLMKGPEHLPRLAWFLTQRSQNWLGSEAQYKLSWRLAAYRLLQIPERAAVREEGPRLLSQPYPSPWPVLAQETLLTEAALSPRTHFPCSAQLPRPASAPHLLSSRCGSQEASSSAAP